MMLMRNNNNNNCSCCSWVFLVIVWILPLVSCLQFPTAKCNNRRDFLFGVASSAACGGVVASSSSSLIQPVWAIFDGGIGGLGKTKPETGVQLFGEPFQESIASRGFSNNFALLSSATGLEARDLQQPESAFVHVIDNVSKQQQQQQKNDLPKIFMDNILGSKGKFGAYAAPTDVRIKKVVDSNLYQATFTTYTPAMRESERKIYLNPQFVGNDKLVVLVVGTTLARFRSKEEMLQKIANSFEFPAASKALW
eukprot:CAMPEP_0116843742 /NCGR_PEP_ID=MMETSP0418-20121206/12263_1 /TAXON_ID=1158023 /ORGANISM="Astrosyne radiata, Strain 13vi08-1A" /LENGTH=251 /DNA_ID=CAMNT_0004474541 /DNA_START=170 /DNA_END=923 /DNA_ORIENTATION=-